MSLCVLRNMNTGVDNCDKSIGKINRVIFAPDGAHITPADGARLYAFLKEKLEAAIPENRWYITPIAPNNIADGSTEPVVASLADGSSEQLLPGNLIQTLEWWSKLSHDKTINKFNQYDGPAFLFTDLGFIGREEGVNLHPINVKIGVSGGGLQTFDTSPRTKKMTINIGDELEFQNNLGFYPLETSRLNTLKGLRDLYLSVVKATGGIANIRLTIGADKKTNVFDIPAFKTAFLNKVNWRANGSATDITSVAADENNKSFEVNVGAGSFVIDTAPIDVLKAAGVEGYEGIPVNVDVTA